MNTRRREVIGASIAATVFAAAPLANTTETKSMFGLIGKMSATPGQRDALIAILLEGTEAMPGCLSYIVAKDAADADGIWITEVWESKDSHAASLQLPAVRAAITRAKPLIAAFGQGTTTSPVGGVGLKVSSGTG